MFLCVWVGGRVGAERCFTIYGYKTYFIGMDMWSYQIGYQIIRRMHKPGYNVVSPSSETNQSTFTAPPQANQNKKDQEQKVGEKRVDLHQWI